MTVHLCIVHILTAKDVRDKRWAMDCPVAGCKGQKGARGSPGPVGPQVRLTISSLHAYHNKLCLIKIFSLEFVHISYIGNNTLLPTLTKILY